MIVAVEEASEEKQVHKPRRFQTGLYSMFALSSPGILWFGHQPGHQFELAQAEEAESLSHLSFCCRICDSPQEQNSFPSLSSEQYEVMRFGNQHYLSNKMFASALQKQLQSLIHDRSLYIWQFLRAAEKLLCSTCNVQVMYSLRLTLKNHLSSF